MANTPVVVLDDTLTDIADAIRAKTGGSATMTPSEMPAEIASIPSGGANNNYANFFAGSTTSLYDNDIVDIPDYTFMVGTSASSTPSSDSTKTPFYKMTSASFSNAETIGGSAFGACVNLQTVSFPKVKSLGDSSFSGCTSLQAIRLPSYITPFPSVQYVFYNCSALSKADFGDNSAVITDNQTIFNQRWFQNCTSLTTLILRFPKKVKYSWSNNFLNTPIASGTGYIYVPRALVDTYKADSGWSSYANQIRAIEDYSVDGTVDGDIIV